MSMGCFLSYWLAAVDAQARQGRRVLALALSASLNAPIADTTFGVFRM